MPRKPNPDEDNLEFDLGDLSAPIEPSSNPTESSDKPVEPSSNPTESSKKSETEVLDTVEDVPNLAEDSEDVFLSNSQGDYVDGMFGGWFLDYASYVILERAVPHAFDGLKPVQRRILHSMRELEDGRYNKVANVIGNTMKYHPHGDASISDAMIQLGQKGLLIDMQGNWGNTLTGDSAAAARYIEARLSKFALEIVFNPKTTQWLASYDGRNQEPETLPVKFPLLLAQGTEGIAVGLSCKILPHNFVELLDGCIAVLGGQSTAIQPDFPSGGIADISDYNAGMRGGRVKVRARIEIRKKNLLAITELPFSKTTTSLIDSIIAANEKGKIKIQRVEDNTADQVEILVYLPSGVDATTAEQALYAFTDCEYSISTNICAIQNGKPQFFSADALLALTANQTRSLLQKELEIELQELDDKWHFCSLEKLFIEERIYRKIESKTSWESVIKAVETGLKPFQDRLKRAVTRDDILRLLEIRIKRISKFDTLRAQDQIVALETQIEQAQHHLHNLTAYAIDWFKRIKEKYGALHPRKTELKAFNRVAAQAVVAANETLYVDYKEGFVGYAMKKADALCKCSNLDDVMVINQAGQLTVSKVSEKAFFGKNLLYVALFNRAQPNEKHFCLVYRDGKKGATLAKHFTIGGITRDKVYDLTKGSAGSRVFYISDYKANDEPADAVKVNLKPAERIRKTHEEVYFENITLRGRSAAGIQVTKNAVRNVIRLPKTERKA